MRLFGIKVSRPLSTKACGCTHRPGSVTVLLWKTTSSKHIHFRKAPSLFFSITDCIGVKSTGLRLPLLNPSDLRPLSMVRGQGQELPAQPSIPLVQDLGCASAIILP